MSLNQRVTAEFSTLYTKRSSLQRLIHPNNSAMCQFPDCRGSKEKPAQLSQLREGLSP
jgi:hypothetical protein